MLFAVCATRISPCSKICHMELCELKAHPGSAGILLYVSCFADKTSGGNVCVCVCVCIYIILYILYYTYYIIYIILYILYYIYYIYIYNIIYIIYII